MKQQYNNTQNITIMNDIFSFSRLWLLLKKDATENYKLFIFGGLSLFLAITALMLISSPIITLPEVGGRFATFLALYGYYFLGGVAASLMFAKMRTKQGKISLFTLPATTCEKYVEQILVYVIGFAVLYLGCLELGELIRCHVAPLIWDGVEGKEGLDMSHFINYFAIPTISPEAAIVMATFKLSVAKIIGIGVAVTICELGLFTLGATLWPRYSYIKTYILSCVISFAGMIISSIMVALMPNAPHDNFVMTSSSSIFLVISSVFAVGYFVASYLIFKHKNVIR